ncbi:hypothetical protein NE237_001005 [Protea cynaroides]|uniref:Uncharacterized protein n=1 Tax=Protea cynaroides TaxID=273540 RepID=A0A9Q0QY12_9MAGN|nr:hypothetical protein NE237_001005 [Protea cynaroides]
MEKREPRVGEEGVVSSSPNNLIRSSTVSEIIEEEVDHGRRDEILGTIKEKYEMITAGDDDGGQDCDDPNVYVAVGKSDSSMDALRWALKNVLINPFSSVFLIHVFPEVHHIPTPLGKFPKNQASPEQLENYMSQESSKRRELLGNFLNLCSASRVRADTILIESDFTAKAVLDLIPILNIRKLVLGTTKSSLRKGRRKGMANVIQKEAPDFCEVRIICEGIDVSMMTMTMTTAPTMDSPSHFPRSSRSNGGVNGRLDDSEDVFSRSPRQRSHN